MQSAHPHQPVNQRSQRLTQSAGPIRNTASPIDRTRSEDSWIEIASQPSSSSLSSVGDEIVTTGLRVQDAARRRKRLRDAAAARHGPLRKRSIGDLSSQEEYEESESESDRVMTSSNEGLTMNSGQHQAGEEAVFSDDENRTAVNAPIRDDTHSVFTPQPNAFSHPPSSHGIRHASAPVPGSYFPHMSARPSRPSARQSFSAEAQHSPYNMISPSHNAAAQHDAALRASLSTLLSCAAAARGLPKARSQTTAILPGSKRVEANTLRLVPASALVNSPAATSGIPSPGSNALPSSSVMSDGQDVHKRKRGSSKDSRRKVRRSSSASSASTVYGSDELFVSPTLLTWIVSAGVVVVMSAISFSAGYSVGHQVGQVEGGLGGAGGDMTCASEVGRGLGLRRLRLPVQA